MVAWLSIGLGAVVVLLLIPVVVGSFLPKEFSAEVDTVIRQPPEVVWAALTDPEKYPMSSGMCRGVERLPDIGGLPAWREDLGSSRVRMTTVESVPPRRRVLDARDEVVPMTMQTVCELTPVEGSTRVHITADGVIESGTWHVPIFRFMIHVFGGAKSGQRQYLAALERGLAGK